MEDQKEKPRKAPNGESNHFEDGVQGVHQCIYEIALLDREKLSAIHLPIFELESCAPALL